MNEQWAGVQKGRANPDGLGTPLVFFKTDLRRKLRAVDNKAQMRHSVRVLIVASHRQPNNTQRGGKKGCMVRIVREQEETHPAKTTNKQTHVSARIRCEKGNGFARVEGPGTLRVADRRFEMV